MVIWIKTAIRITRCEVIHSFTPPDTPAPWDVSFTIPSGLYNCRESSTKSHLFMQNKANFKKLPMSANPFTKATYGNFHHFLQPKNKANSKPNKANFKKRKNEHKLFITKGL